VHASVTRLGGRDVSVGVDETRLVRLLLSGLGHSLALLHDHSVGASAGRNHHGGEGATSLNTLIVHDVLGVVLLHGLTIGIFEAVRLYNTGLSSEIIAAGLLSVVS